jgi:Hexokinase
MIRFWGLQMLAGLSGQPETLLMLPTMVDILPTGRALSTCSTPLHLDNASSNKKISNRVSSSNVLLPPCRHENGTFLSIDIGGTNARVLCVELSKERGQVVSCGKAAMRLSIHVAALGAQSR